MLPYDYASELQSAYDYASEPAYLKDLLELQIFVGVSRAYWEMVDLGFKYNPSSSLSPASSAAGERLFWPIYKI